MGIISRPFANKIYSFKGRYHLGFKLSDSVPLICKEMEFSAVVLVVFLDLIQLALVVQGGLCHAKV